MMELSDRLHAVALGPFTWKMGEIQTLGEDRIKVSHIM